MRTFAFFDLDHTLLPFDTQALFCNYVLRRERWRTGLHLLFAPFAVGKALRLVSTVKAKRAFLNYLWGLDEKKMKGYARDFADHSVKQWLYPEMLEIIEQHRAAGRVLILNTASPDFYPQEIARVLGFDHCIATRIQPYPVMPFLPQVVGSNNKHGAKIDAMKRDLPIVAEATPEQLKESWAFSDSKADLPLLEFAGNAVLVHPDPSLAALGRERGWPVLKPKRPYGSKIGDMGCVMRQFLGLYPEQPPKGY